MRGNFKTSRFFASIESFLYCISYSTKWRFSTSLIPLSLCLEFQNIYRKYFKIERQVTQLISLYFRGFEQETRSGLLLRHKFKFMLSKQNVRNSLTHHWSSYKWSIQRLELNTLSTEKVRLRGSSKILSIDQISFMSNSSLLFCYFLWITFQMKNWVVDKLSHG